jgi:hypothetical protein
MEALIRIGMAFLPLILAAAGCGALAARRRFWLGFGAGLITLWTPPLVIVMVFLPRPQECATSPLACEWVGIGIWFLMAWVLVSTLAYLALSRVIYTWQCRWVTPKGEAQLLPGAGRQAAILGLRVVILALVGAALGRGVVFLAEQGAFVTWKSLGRPLDETGLGVFAEERLVAIAHADLWRVYLRTNANHWVWTERDLCFERRRSAGNCWMLVSDSRSIPTPSPPPTCPEFTWVYPLPEKTLHRVRVVGCHGIWGAQAEYALLASGEVWVWYNETQSDPLNHLAALILGGLVGTWVGSFWLVGGMKQR